MRERLRTFPTTIITAECIDCRKTFRGPLAVSFIKTPDGLGIEISVIDDATETAHAIARVQKEVVPTVEIEIERKENGS